MNEYACNYAIAHWPSTRVEARAPDCVPIAKDAEAFDHRRQGVRQGGRHEVEIDRRSVWGQWGKVLRIYELVLAMIRMECDVYHLFESLLRATGRLNLLLPCAPTTTRPSTPPS